MLRGSFAVASKLCVFYDALRSATDLPKLVISESVGDGDALIELISFTLTMHSIRPAIMKFVFGSVAADIGMRLRFYDPTRC
jgi:hypothetical protein